MKQRIYFIIIALVSFATQAADLTFTGNSRQAVSIAPASNTGLARIYVLENSNGVTASFTTLGSDAVNWYRFDNRGAAYAEPIATMVNGRTTSFTLGIDDIGIVVEEGSKRHYFWIINYANHPFEISGLNISEESDCSTTTLLTEGSGSQILFYNINGVPTELSREIELTYYTLEYNAETESYDQIEESIVEPWLTATIRTPAPLCDTQFTLKGDRFLSAWGMEQQVESETYQAKAVDAHTTAVQTEREVDNEVSVEVSSLGGSAPVEITFTATVSDAVRFTEWQFSSDPEFNNYDLRFNDTEVTYTFREQGTTYIRFQASNNEGDCDWFSETYEVHIGESKLQCPNAFSPNDDGVNDVWKVSYKSIVEFQCSIFNRWGTEIISFDNPAQGWDGKYNGKVVDSGVYYYAIRAKGADGKKYKLSGDINIVNYSRETNKTQP